MGSRGSPQNKQPRRKSWFEIMNERKEKRSSNEGVGDRHIGKTNHRIEGQERKGPTTIGVIKRWLI